MGYIGPCSPILAFKRAYIRPSLGDDRRS